MAATDPTGPDPRAIEALLAFWAEAGVDVALGETPVNRLAAPPPRAPATSARLSAAPEPLSAPGAPAARPALTADSLEALAEAVAAFEGCALRAHGSGRAIFAHLPARADLIVVAEAPGVEDEGAGAPFSGPAGKLVRTLLTHAGLGRRRDPDADRVLAPRWRGGALGGRPGRLPSLPRTPDRAGQAPGDAGDG